MQESSEELVPHAVPVEPVAATFTPGRLFVGPEGLRAGWSLLLYVLLVALLGFAAGKIYTATHPEQRAKAAQLRELQKRDPAAARAQIEADAAKRSNDSRPRQTLGSHGLPLLVMALAALVMAFIERRRFSWYGFWCDRTVLDLGLGLLWGLVCLSVLVGVLRVAGVLVFDGVLLHGSAAMASGAAWFAAFLLVGLAEEFMFRGYIQYTLTRGIRGMFPPDNRFRRVAAFWIAAFVLSALFLLAHGSNPGETPVGLIGVFLAGMLFCFALWRTGSLWWAIGFHATWDWAQSFLFGVGDSGTFSHGRLMATHPQGNSLLSGGTTGPEGSLFLLPTFVLAALIIHFTLPQRAQPPIAPLDREPLPSAEENAAPAIA